LKEHQITSRVREAELQQQIADMHEKFADTELKRVEKWTTDQLMHRPDDDDEDNFMTRSISSVCSDGAEFQAMIQKMKVQYSSLSSSDQYACYSCARPPSTLAVRKRARSAAKRR
jgi:hypothetical protein